jgi:HPt (histidine-containing phosphotransfer) domain-containing protein
MQTANRQGGITDRLEQLVEFLGAEAVAEIVELFLAEAPQRVSQMYRALGGRDRETLAASAHGLRGSSAGLGADAVASLCVAVETLAPRGSFDAAGRLLSQLEAEVDEVAALLSSGALPVATYPVHLPGTSRARALELGAP